MFIWEIVSSVFKNPNQSKDLVVITKEIMSWLFNDPINNDLAQFDHGQLNSKKWSKGQFFIVQNFKKILRADPKLWRCAIFAPRMAHLSWTKKFLVQTIAITFIYLLALFIVQNFKKFLLWIQSYEDAQFLGPKWPISPNENFFQKIC